MKFVTDGSWGVGLHRLLNPDEIDQNIYDLLASINSVVNNPPSPLQLVAVRLVNGNQLFFDMSDGSSLGPIYIPIQAFHWRDEWTPFTGYQTLDVFKVSGVGLYFVLQNYTSGATFDKTVIVGSTPALLEMFAFAPAENLVYDIYIRYPGVLSLIPAGITYISNEPMVRPVLLPVSPGSIAVHQAYLDTPASTANQIFNIYSNDSLIGNAAFIIGTNVGAVALSSDTVFSVSQRLSVARQTVNDPVAAGLSIVLAAQQIVS